MSSRSNGVTKVELTRRMIEWVVSSAACSASFISAAIWWLEPRVRYPLVLPSSSARILDSVHEVVGGLGEKVVERRVVRTQT